MKKSTLGRVGLLTLVLCLTSVCLLGGTLAKYTTTITGTGSGTVASWNFTANSEASAYGFTLAGTGTSSKILPGDSGTFDIALSNTSDVAADYTIALSSLPENMTFKLTDTNGTVITTSNHIEGTLAQANGSAKVTVYWAYTDIETPPDNKSLSLTATVTGMQAAADATPATAAVVANA